MDLGEPELRSCVDVRSVEWRVVGEEFTDDVEFLPEPNETINFDDIESLRMSPLVSRDTSKTDAVMADEVTDQENDQSERTEPNKQPIRDLRRHDSLPPTRQQKRLQRSPRDNPPMQEDESPGNDSHDRVRRQISSSEEDEILADNVDEEGDGTDA